MTKEHGQAMRSLLGQAEVELPDEEAMRRAVEAHHPSPRVAVIDKVLGGVVNGRGGENEVKIEQEAEMRHAQQQVDSEVTRNGNVGWRRKV